MDITVCTGGACCEGGAELLLDACSVLAAGDATIEVKTAFCSGECPANLAMLSPRRGAMEAYEAKCSTVDEAIASATAAIALAESQVGDGLTEVFVALAEAKAAALAGDAATARERYAAALAGAPPGLLEPCQQPLEPETLEWAGSRWAEDWYSTELGLATAEESAEQPEAAFGTCGGGNRVVDRKVVPKPTLTLRDCTIDGLRLSGRWDDTDGGAGEVELLMSESGRTFEGTLRSDEAGPEAAASNPNPDPDPNPRPHPNPKPNTLSRSRGGGVDVEGRAQEQRGGPRRPRARRPGRHPLAGGGCCCCRCCCRAPSAAATCG